MKKDVAKWQTSPDAALSPEMTPKAENGTHPVLQPAEAGKEGEGEYAKSETSIDKIPLLDHQTRKLSEASRES